MAEESRTRVCAGCGFPAIATMRRCPFCREAFPRARVPAVHRAWPLDPLTWLALAWAALTIPAVLLTLTVLGPALALIPLTVCLAPAACVWLVRGRTVARIRRLNRRAGRGRTRARHIRDGGAAGSGQPPSDARSR